MVPTEVINVLIISHCFSIKSKRKDASPAWGKRGQEQDFFPGFF